MSDLISRQAAIESLGEEPLVWKDDDEYTIGERQQWRDDVKAISSLPSVSQWIPCGERLPEDRQRCLVTIGDNNQGIIVISTYSTNLRTVSQHDFNTSKPGWYGFDPEFGYYEETQIVAWMPMPKPYKRNSHG